MKSKNTYTEPEMELVVLRIQDIVVTSGEIDESEVDPWA